MNKLNNNNNGMNTIYVENSPPPPLTKKSFTIIYYISACANIKYCIFYRYVLTFIVMDYDIPKSVEQCRVKLREEFEKNRHVTDIRVIDMLVIKVRT